MKKDVLAFFIAIVQMPKYAYYIVGIKEIFGEKKNEFMLYTTSFMQR